VEPYFGIIEIGKIENRQATTAENNTTLPFIDLTESNIRFVHYPDCQQLIIWLTHPGREYGNMRLVNNEKKEVAGEWPVSDKLSGSIQILWDTLNIPPGKYSIEIDHNNGGQHIIDIEKYEEGVVIEKEQPIAVEEDEEKPYTPIQYRDGFGNLLENEDLVLREKVNAELSRKFFRHIEYEGNFRSGTIIYIDGDKRIEFYHEMGGGNCMFYVDIPTEEKWEAQTKTLLSSRKEILEFVATTVQRQQASNCNYEIKNDAIIFYYKENSRR